jgi:hypothetical protein
MPSPPARPALSLRKIVSGGQAGVDRAALDAALELGLPCGGWCPRGRRAEDGPIPPRYPLTETPTASYPQRTEWNVRDSDGTLVLHLGYRDRGTGLTLRLAGRYRRPSLEVDLRRPGEPATLRDWAAREGVAVLNVAGPRESRNPGVHDAAFLFLLAALRPRRHV